MKLKTKTVGMATIVVLLLVAMPVGAEWYGWDFDGSEVYAAGSKNFGLSYLKYDSENKTIYFYMTRWNTTYNNGLGFFEMAFNKSFAPPLEGMQAYAVIDGSLHLVVDLVKNVTIIQDAVQVYWDDPLPNRPCSYLYAYIYLFEDKEESVSNERPFDNILLGNFIFREGEVPDTKPKTAIYADSSRKITQQYSTETNYESDIVVIMGDVSLFNWTPIHTYTIIGGVAIVALVILTYFVYRRL